MISKMLIAILLIVPMVSYADYDFSEIDNIETVKKESDAKKQREIILEKKKRDIALNRIKVQKERNKAELAHKKLDEKIHDKKRDQAYRDELRAIQLQTLKAKANRTDEYINAELGREVAKNDVIRAKADRALASGKAEIIRAENPQDVDINITVEER